MGDAGSPLASFAGEAYISVLLDQVCNCFSADNTYSEREGKRVIKRELEWEWEREREKERERERKRKSARDNEREQERENERKS